MWAAGAAAVATPYAVARAPSGTTVNVPTPYAWPVGTWTHVVCVFSALTDTVTLYTNAVVVGRQGVTWRRCA